MIRECNKNPLYPIANFMSFQKFSPSHKAFLSKINTIPIPKTLHEALRNENRKTATREEMNAVERNQTWEIVELPKEKKIVGCTWVYALKIKLTAA